MRSSALVCFCSISLLAGTPALAGNDDGVFVDSAGVQVAHEEKKERGHEHDHDHDNDHDHDQTITREELEERKQELRKQERELRERERRKPLTTQVWLGLGTGVAYASVDVACSPSFFGSDCSEDGDLRTYSANLTWAGRHTALRLRGIRDQDKGGDARTAYEQAVLIGSRFGRSNWYGLAGYGRIRHVDDQFLKDKAEGFAWEILFAPSSEGPAGLELSFQGHSGKDVDFVGFTIGLRVGAIR